MSLCYLIHFERPIGNPDSPRGQAQHYLGYTGKESLKARLARHKSGNGARIMAVVSERGIPWQVARTWSHGTRALERRLKNRHNAPRLCPICRGEKRDDHNSKRLQGLD